MAEGDKAAGDKAAGDVVLSVEDVWVEAAGGPVLRGVSLEIGAGETHVLLGPNGSGKTTLIKAIMGMSGYRVTRGRIRFRGQDLHGLSVDERARLGLGIALQRPPEVPEVSLEKMLEVAAGGRDDGERRRELAERLHCAHLLGRAVNRGFSGGEMKRAELLQLLAQSPEMLLIDEPESGVDLESIALVGAAINELLGKTGLAQGRRSGLLITHTGNILDYVEADIAHVLLHGAIKCTGEPRNLFAEIKRHGYEGCVECVSTPPRCAPGTP